MVQTEAQYKFVYMAVLHYLETEQKRKRAEEVSLYYTVISWLRGEQSNYRSKVVEKIWETEQKRKCAEEVCIYRLLSKICEIFHLAAFVW